VRQLEKADRIMLVRLIPRAPLLPGPQVLAFGDIDSCATIISIPPAAPVNATTRRPGRANSGPWRGPDGGGVHLGWLAVPGVAARSSCAGTRRFVARRLAPPAGPAGQAFSVTARMDAKAEAVIATIGEDERIPISA
jgi:hypothetical protein